MDLANVLTTAKNGKHPACKECPWNPKRSDKPAFGVSCTKHGIDWSISASAVSMLIAQDPAGTTPEKTGILCGLCNVQYMTDHSANHGYSLWKAAVSLSESGPNASKYMKGHYWTNAIMHGMKDSKQRENARMCCEDILLEQISLLSPKIIIATGKVASESLYDLNIVTNDGMIIAIVFLVWFIVKMELYRPARKSRSIALFTHQQLL